MEIRAAVPPTAPAEPQPATPRVKPEGQGLTPSDVPLLTADRLDLDGVSSNGQSLTELPFAESAVASPAETASPPDRTLHPAFELQDIKPRLVQSEEIEQVLDVYHTKVRERLEGAADNSLLGQFETSVRLVSQLRNPDLRREDRQAWDILQMRKSQIESEYERLVQSPEIRETFESARIEALEEVFTDRRLRAHQQAAYLLSDSFQEELLNLEPEAIQHKVQQELSALSIMSPRLAEGISEDLLEKTLRFQAMRLIQAGDAAGDAARATLSDALGVYLRAQQSAARVGMQANNLAILANLSDEKIVQLTQAVANLTQGAQASTPQQLAQVLVNRVEQLPAELQPSATALLARMQTQNILGTVLLAGSVTSLLQNDLPADPEAWARLTASSLSTASMSHFALRMAGMGQAADVASKINYTAQLGAVRVPVLFSVVVGINTTLDAMAVAREIRNEDPVGTAARMVGVGSGLATIAAMTVMSGPAAPITLIGSTVVGLAAWGIESAYGESETSGQIRQDLRQLGILDREEATVKGYQSDPDSRPFWQMGPGLPQKDRLLQAPVSDKVQVINQLMDGATSAAAEKLIYDVIMESPAEEFLPLMRQLNAPRLAEELEDKAQLLKLMQRLTQSDSPGESARMLESMVGRLAQQTRYGEIQAIWPEIPAQHKEHFSAEGLARVSRAVKARWQPGMIERQSLVQILTDPALSRQSLSLLSRRDDQHLLELRNKLSTGEMSQLLSHLSRSPDPEAQALLERLYTPSGKKNTRRQGQSLSRLGSNASAAYLTAVTLRNLSDSEIKNLNPVLRERMQNLLQRLQNQPMLDRSVLREQLKRLQALS